jgi:hypothetical protein
MLLHALETGLRRASPDAGPKAQFGAVSFLDRFGAFLNPHFRCHCCVLDGTFVPDAAGAVRFREATELTQALVDPVQASGRRWVVKAFVRCAWSRMRQRRCFSGTNQDGRFSLIASLSGNNQSEGPLSLHSGPSAGMPPMTA